MLANEELTDINKLTLSQIVTNNFRAAAIFEKYDLDFCCRGNKPIEQACTEKGINKEPIISELENLFTSTPAADAKYENWQLDFLSDYIINNHHTYVRNMIPIISAHAEKVAMVHGARHPEVIDVAKKFAVVYKDLKQHMMKEEEILFPYIKRIVTVKNNKAKPEPPYFGTVKNPIKMMEAEHEAAGDEMFEIRSITNGYNPPADACNTYKALYQELKDFEEDLHKHVHLENYILFPKSILLEEEILNAA